MTKFGLGTTPRFDFRSRVFEGTFRIFVIMQNLRWDCKLRAWPEVDMLRELAMLQDIGELMPSCFYYITMEISAPHKCLFQTTLREMWYLYQGMCFTKRQGHLSRKSFSCLSETLCMHVERHVLRWEHDLSYVSQKIFTKCTVKMFAT